MNRLFVNNGAEWRLLRTIIQGVIGVIIAYIDILIGFVSMPDEMRPFVVALVMAVLSPIMKSLGKDAMDKPELDDNYFEGDEE